MIPAQTAPIAASPTDATVIFIHGLAPLPATCPSGSVCALVTPKHHNREPWVRIVTESGRFLGDSAPDSHFAVTMPPGQHLLVAWPLSGDALTAVRATLVAGRIYYVEVRAGEDSYSPHTRGPIYHHSYVKLLAIHRSETDDPTQMIGHTRRLVPDTERGAWELAGDFKMDHRLRAAMELAASYSPYEAADRTIQEADGY
jgi:hypothetical protein